MTITRKMPTSPGTEKLVNWATRRCLNIENGTYTGNPVLDNAIKNTLCNKNYVFGDGTVIRSKRAGDCIRATASIPQPVEKKEEVAEVSNIWVGLPAVQKIEGEGQRGYGWLMSRISDMATWEFKEIGKTDSDAYEPINVLSSIPNMPINDYYDGGLMPTDGATFQTEVERPGGGSIQYGPYSFDMYKMLIPNSGQGDRIVWWWNTDTFDGPRWTPRYIFDPLRPGNIYYTTAVPYSSSGSTRSFGSFPSIVGYESLYLTDYIGVIIANPLPPGSDPAYSYTFDNRYYFDSGSGLYLDRIPLHDFGRVSPAIALADPAAIIDTYGTVNADYTYDSRKAMSSLSRGHRVFNDRISTRHVEHTLVFPDAGYRSTSHTILDDKLESYYGNGISLVGAEVCETTQFTGCVVFEYRTDPAAIERDDWSDALDSDWDNTEFPMGKLVGQFGVGSSVGMEVQVNLYFGDCSDPNVEGTTYTLEEFVIDEEYLAKNYVGGNYEGRNFDYVYDANFRNGTAMFPEGSELGFGGYATYFRGFGPKIFLYNYYNGWDHNTVGVCTSSGFKQYSFTENEHEVINPGFADPYLKQVDIYQHPDLGPFKTLAGYARLFLEETQ